MTIYADSSFLVSIYVDDVHSSEADRRMAMGEAVYATPLNRAEIAHAMHQSVFRGKLTLFEVQCVWENFEQDWSSGVWVQAELPSRTWQTGIDLARQHGPTLGTRTLDSLHVACALELKAKRFWTFDDRQLRLAEAVGLDTSV